MNKEIAPKQRLDIQSILASNSKRGIASPLWRKLRWVVAAAVVLAVVGLVRYISGSAQSVHYVTQPATRGVLTVVVTATGSVQPTNKVDVSSELSGTVRKVLVDYNSTVAANDVLAILDTDKLKATADSSAAKLAAARAKVAEADATVKEKDLDLVRKKALSLKQVGATRDLEAAQAAYDRAVASLLSARADIAVAEADLKLNETNLEKAQIRSPISGVVLKRNVDPGQTVASTLQAPVLFSIAEDLRQMELQVDVDEADVGHVKPGQKASFSVDAFPDRKFPATIRDVRFASETIQGVVTYKAVLNIDNSELLLRPGMTATAEIRVTEIDNALLVPNAALRYTPPATAAVDQRSFLRRLLPGPPAFRAASPREEQGPNRTVWVLRDGQPVALKVVVGPSDGKRTQIEKGEFSENQLLIVDQTSARQ